MVMPKAKQMQVNMTDTTHHISLSFQNAFRKIIWNMFFHNIH